MKILDVFCCFSVFCCFCICFAICFEAGWIFYRFWTRGEFELGKKWAMKIFDVFEPKMFCLFFLLGFRRGNPYSTLFFEVLGKNNPKPS